VKKILIGSILLVMVVLGAAELRPYRLINADLGTASEINGERVISLDGNVHFFYGETEFFSDRAQLYEASKLTILQGNVLVLEDTLSLKADKVEYLRIEEILQLRGEVFVKETHYDNTYSSFAADSINYLRNKSILDAWSNVEVFDQREKANGICGKLHYELNNGYGYLLQRPKITVKDSLKISAEKIEYYEEFSKITANFDVVTESPDFMITSDFLLYFNLEQKAFFLGNPKFESDFADAKAVEIHLYFENEELSKAELTEDCLVNFATKQGEKRTNWIKSKEMILSFVDGDITLCEASENVTSLYNQEKSKRKTYLQNKVTAQKMKITFINQEVDEIYLKNNIDGVYKFIK